MQILYNNEYYKIENKLSAINEIFEKVNEVLEKKDVVFSHLIIDDQEIFENHEAFIKDHINDIVSIEIITMKVKEMIWETMQSIHSYLQNAIPALSELIDDSYVEFSVKTWEGIDNLAEGMQWMFQFMTFTKSAPQKPAKWEDIEKNIVQCKNVFVQLLEAVELKDTILISDILSYEVAPTYKTLEEHLAISLNDGEFLSDVN